MKIIVLGAGSIGLVFGGFLAKAGHRVVFLGPEQNVSEIKRHGLFIEGLWGNHLIKNMVGYTNLEELKNKEGKSFDLVLLTVKSYDTENMLKAIHETFADPMLILSLQNGLGNLDKMCQIIGPKWAIAGRVIFGAEIDRPGRVSVTVYAEEVMIGGVENGIDYQKVTEVADILTDAGIPTLPTREINKYIWGKVLYNSALNGLGAILGVKYGFLKEHESSRMLIAGIVQEFFKVSEKENVTLDWPTPGAYLDYLFERLIPATYDHYPSMLRDIQHRKRTEIDSINGAIVEIARKHGIDVPVNWLITALVKTKEKIALGIKI
ncbi:MAG: 2-dehydropantoate 2-reductase [Thermodesulfobacteriota bacterium]|jgi:2-dehydropantoate 2-reductase|nr:MAG: 2-dehydropantoate 2-reductase [Thermodesulfobacteriota bacterium]